jgi:hypothetical protein
MLRRGDGDESVEYTLGAPESQAHAAPVRRGDDNAQMDVTSTEEDLPELVRRAEEAAAAWVRGDMGRYLDLVHHASGFTLLAPRAVRRPGTRTGTGSSRDGRALRRR